MGDSDELRIWGRFMHDTKDGDYAEDLKACLLSAPNVASIAYVKKADRGGYDISGRLKNQDGEAFLNYLADHGYRFVI